MPKRVIDIGPSDGPLEPRLHHSGAKTGHWATLSHCWGKTVTMKLTSATLEQRIQGIRMTELPQNFRDAIIVTRILGIRYLWIDSLCIIQDSTEDWLQESSKMGEIYKNSVITIAATNAEESTAGFLRKRRAEAHCNLQVRKHERLAVYVRTRTEWYGFAEIVGPLTRRGWVLQERLLPVRILHFGGQQMIWQCRKNSLAEGFCDTDSPPEEQIPGAIESTLRATFHTQILASFDAENELGPKSLESTILGSSPVDRGKVFPTKKNIYEEWYRLIGMYSKLKLTKHTDKLPAIAGIARQIQQRTGDIYLAGLWKSDLQRGLQWWCNPPSVLVKPSTPQAPSWSWAALNLLSDEPSAHISGAMSLSPKTYAPDDQGHGIELVNFSPNITAHGCLGSALGSITLLGFWTGAEYTLANAPPGRFSLSYPTPLVLKKQGSTICAAARLDVNEDIQIDSREIGCLQVGKFQQLGPKYPNADFISALLLRRVSQKTDQAPAQYSRIGLAVLLDTCDPLNGWEKREVEVV